MSGNRFHAFNAPESFWRVASVPEYALVADLGWIRHKHPKEFPTDKALTAFIETVIGSPELSKIPGTSKNAFLFFIVLSGQCAVIEMTAFKLASGEKAYRINTAFTLQPRPLAKAILALEKNSGLDANPDSGGSDPKAAHPGTPSQSFEEASRCKNNYTPATQKKKPGEPMIKKAPKAKTNPKAKEKAKPKAKPNPSTATETAPGVRFGLGAGLATAWKKWTGADPGQTFKLRLVDGLKDCPSEVVMLGRITKLITKSGQIERFTNGPYMVTDSAMKKVWLVDQRDRSFALNLKGGIIIYLAKKPKFGDKQAIEYVHLFQGAIRAEMHGQVGRLEGPYKLTPAGIEG